MSSLLDNNLAGILALRGCEGDESVSLRMECGRSVTGEDLEGSAVFLDI